MSLYAAAFVLSTLTYVKYGISKYNTALNVLGIIGSFTTIVMYGSPLASVVRRLHFKYKFESCLTD